MRTANTSPPQSSQKKTRKRKTVQPSNQRSPAVTSLMFSNCNSLCTYYSTLELLGDPRGLSLRDFQSNFCTDGNDQNVQWAVLGQYLASQLGLVVATQEDLNFLQWVTPGSDSHQRMACGIVSMPTVLKTRLHVAAFRHHAKGAVIYDSRKQQGSRPEKSSVNMYTQVFVRVRTSQDAEGVGYAGSMSRSTHSYRRPRTRYYRSNVVGAQTLVSSRGKQLPAVPKQLPAAPKQ